MAILFRPVKAVRHLRENVVQGARGAGFYLFAGRVPRRTEKKFHTSTFTIGFLVAFVAPRGGGSAAAVAPR